MVQVLALFDRTLPTLGAVVDRRPASVSTVDLDALQELLDEIARVASPELRQAIRDLQRGLRSGELLSRFGVSVELG